MRDITFFRTGFFLKVTLSVLLLIPAYSAFAEIAVIVHPSNGTAMEKGVIAKIFLGKTKKFPGGGTAVPMNQPEASAERAAFNKQALNKTSAQLKAYWSKLVFTGKGTPPREVDSGEMKSLISANPNLIGYIDAAQADDSVRVIHKY
ncbi:MAG: phosphate ABC transporter substrate-binding protein [Pseudomonadales bacterium]|nr:phosphate ABC transporter substrate-binding protein [Pseudomonadales bacterium]